MAEGLGSQQLCEVAALDVLEYDEDTGVIEPAHVVHGHDCGMAKAAAFWASLRNVSICSRERNSPGRGTLTATSRESSSSRARYTVPKPPRPTCLMTTYRPRRSGSGSDDWARASAPGEPMLPTVASTDPAHSPSRAASAAQRPRSNATVITWPQSG